MVILLIPGTLLGIAFKTCATCRHHLQEEDDAFIKNCLKNGVVGTLFTPKGQAELADMSTPLKKHSTSTIQNSIVDTISAPKEQSELGGTSTPLVEHSTGTIQNNSSPLSGRIEMRLPADDKYRKGWEILGIKWLESLDEEPFLAKALLPEGWTTQRAYTLYSDHNDITIIDNKGQEQVKMWIKTAFYDQVANVSFLKIDKKLLEQTDKQELEVANKN